MAGEYKVVFLHETKKKDINGNPIYEEDADSITFKEEKEADNFIEEFNEKLPLWTRLAKIKITS